jgi:rsbT co-antagonist protein RsbR
MESDNRVSRGNRWLENLGVLIIKHQVDISLKISEQLDDRYNQFLYQSNLKDEEIVKWRAQLIDSIGQAFMEGNPLSVWDRINNWATETSAGSVQYNIGVDELFQTIRIYREVIWDSIEELIDENVSFQTFLRVNKIIDTILDQVAYQFSITYVKYHTRSMSLIKEAMLEISTPIVSISRSTAILPLVGEIDTYRARVLMETTLDKCVALKKTRLIIDLSGVPIVDTMVAHELFKVASALNLIGVESIFTGIRPEIAQSMVALGIDFSIIKTTGTLEQALKNIIE